MSRLHYVRAALVGLATVAVATSLAAQDAVTKEVTRLEDAWSAAIVKKDGAAVAKLLAEDMTSVGTDGVVHTKAQVVQNASTDTRQYASAANTEYRVRTIGKVAVITGLWTSSVKAEKGNVQSRARWTDVWVKQADGHWLCVSSQTTTVSK